MDLGLAGLLGRFEHYFGKTDTKAVLGLIGLTVVTVCIQLLISAMWPLLEWLFSAHGREWRDGIVIALFAAYVAFGVGYFAHVYEIHQQMKATRATHDAVDDFLTRAKAEYANAQEALEENKLLHQQIAQVNAEQKVLTSQIAEWEKEIARVESERLEKIQGSKNRRSIAA